MKLAAVLINPDELLINVNQMFVNVAKFQQNFVGIQHRSSSPLLPEFDEIIAGIRRVLPKYRYTINTGDGLTVFFSRAFSLFFFVPVRKIPVHLSPRYTVRVYPYGYTGTGAAETGKARRPI